MTRKVLVECECGGLTPDCTLCSGTGVIERPLDLSKGVLIEDIPIEEQQEARRILSKHCRYLPKRIADVVGEGSYSLQVIIDMIHDDFEAGNFNCSSLMPVMELYRHS